MPLSCSCDGDWEPEPGEWCYWGESNDFESMAGWIRKRCCSCNELISIRTPVIRVYRYRYPYNEIESRIIGIDWDSWEEPPIRISDRFLCEKCGEIFLNLKSVGFECISPGEDMREMLHDYQVEYTPPKLNLKK